MPWKIKILKTPVFMRVSVICKNQKIGQKSFWPQFIPQLRKSPQKLALKIQYIRVWRSWERGWFGTIRPQVRSLSLGPKKAQESMFLSLFSIYEGWRKPSALALYDHPNKLEFVYLSNLQISTLKRYLLTHSPFSIGQQRFPLWEISTLCHRVLMFTIMTFYHNVFVTNRIYNISCERKRSEWHLDLE